MSQLPPYTKKHGFFTKLVDDLLVTLFCNSKKGTEWYNRRTLCGLLHVLGLRVELRRDNLHDTDGDLIEEKPGCPFHVGPNATSIRTVGGTQNDLKYPAMGCCNTRLGRNVPREKAIPDLANLLKPNPLVVSQRLLARDVFKPAPTLNLLAAAWIQFQVHDWFGHNNEDLDSGMMHHVPKAGDWKSEVMIIPKTQPDPDKLTTMDNKSPAYRSKNPQWWDGSQVYGESKEEVRWLRTDQTTQQIVSGGKLYMRDGLLPINESNGITLSGFVDNWWLGLEILHTLFAKEHNHICDALKAKEPHLTDDEIFETARLVNCAIMAKIHTIEWTPGILDHPVIQPGLDANWMGVIGHLFGEGVARIVANFLPIRTPMKEVLTGIPLSETDHHGAPYALTEEFTAVYRLHPLIPDEVTILDSKDGAKSATYSMTDIAFSKARTPLLFGASMDDVIYSFGVANPGAITIRNYPKFLRHLELPPNDITKKKQLLDLAAVDILRDRERGVPRYNEFRRQLRKKPITSWIEMAGGRDDIAIELEQVYGGNLEAVDTMVGMFCEPLPNGFGFSDTAFRIFILMASRRLKSDRFFTTDFREEFYTKTGLEWIRKTGMRDVLVRHHKSLEPYINSRNPFGPWTRFGD